MADPTSPEWFRGFGEELESDEGFRRAMRHFDGAITLDIGDDRIWMKVYRGRILEVAGAEAEFGSTFSLEGPAAEWERLLCAERNPFGEQRWLGEIAVGGNTVEATRVEAGVNVLIERLREATPDDLSLGGSAE